MAKYVDGFVLVVPKKSLNAYKRLARVAGKIWRKHGALDYKECIGDDLRPKGIKLPFPKMARLKPREAVFFSYIVYRSRAHRDRVNARVMKDPVMAKYCHQPMPFDMKRLAYGGFKVFVEA